jgi:hypothetical protein
MQYLYLIKCQQYYKIGVANDVQSRLAQLSTGNPFELEPVTVCGFDNASAVEAVLHQRFESRRVRGEWFDLDSEDLIVFDKIILLLNVHHSAPEITDVNDEEIEEAEEIQEITTPKDIVARWDYTEMFRDGWQMQIQDSRGLYWIWRKRKNGSDESMWGGTISSLPYPMHLMRSYYRDRKEADHE